MGNAEYKENMWWKVERKSVREWQSIFFFGKQAERDRRIMLCYIMCMYACMT